MLSHAKVASIGARVRKLRKERRWTQVRLATLLKISQGHLSQLEHGIQSFSAEQLLTILKQFNVSLDYISPEKAPSGSQIQNALAREGAGHLAESEAILPSEGLKNATAAIREALISADSARQVAAVAPVLVQHAGQINLTRLRNEFAELGLENRLAWAVETTLKAIEIESALALPREWRLKYRRAALIIEAFFRPWLIAPNSTTSPDRAQPPLYDVLDPEITSPEGLKEVIEKLSPVARRWRIATGIEVDDFITALKGARGAD
jgi:transcriptional regulator with XRE-family HTH domain